MNLRACDGSGEAGRMVRAALQEGVVARKQSPGQTRRTWCVSSI